MTAIAATAGIEVADARARLRVVTGGATVEHLFSVAAGLDSMVVGEREVAGQVRRALEQAHAAGTTSSDLEALFQGASRVSRAVARRTGLADAGRSVVAVALDEAEARRPLTGARVLLVGTGSYAGASVAALRERGAASVVVHSPSGRAEQFAASHGLEAAAPGGLDAALAGADVVVACSGSSGSVVDAEAVRRARLGGGGPAVLVDLALRRDIDPDVAQVPGVHLVDLGEVARHAPEALDAAVADGRVIVEAETARLLAVLAERDAAPAVRAVRDHVEAALAEVAARYPDDPHVQRALRQFAASLLHQPVNRARSYARIGKAPDFEAALGTFLGVAVESPGRASRTDHLGLRRPISRGTAPGPRPRPCRTPASSRPAAVPSPPAGRGPARTRASRRR